MTPARIHFVPTPDMSADTVTGQSRGRPAHWIATRGRTVIGAYSHTLSGWWAIVPGQDRLCRTESAARLWIIRTATGEPLAATRPLIPAPRSLMARENTDPEEAPLTPEEEAAHDRQGELVRGQIEERRRLGQEAVPPLSERGWWR